MRRPLARICLGGANRAPALVIYRMRARTKGARYASPRVSDVTRRARRSIDEKKNEKKHLKCQRRRARTRQGIRIEGPREREEPFPLRIFITFMRKVFIFLNRMQSRTSVFLFYGLCRIIFRKLYSFLKNYHLKKLYF